MEQKSGYIKARNLFLALFLLSTGVAIVLAIFSTSMTLTAPDPSIEGNADVLTIGGLVAIVSSCITSLVTLVGFGSTTILAWRKETREKEDRELERKRKEIELEKQKLELERIKGEQKDQVQK
jgi:preprotein translocase subunit YajC